MPSQALPTTAIGSSVQKYSYRDGWTTYEYALLGYARVVHVSPGNYASLQSEATKLFEEIQQSAPLKRSGSGTPCYFLMQLFSSIDELWREDLLFTEVFDVTDLTPSGTLCIPQVILAAQEYTHRLAHLYGKAPSHNVLCVEVQARLGVHKGTEMVRSLFVFCKLTNLFGTVLRGKQNC
jgi:hypothetical protein